jgi:hypothetical protein
MSFNAPLRLQATYRKEKRALLCNSARAFVALCGDRELVGWRSRHSRRVARKPWRQTSIQCESCRVSCFIARFLSRSLIQCTPLDRTLYF